MKILVFGGSGPIGSKIVEKFLDGNDVVYTYHNNEIDIPGAISKKIEITNRDEVTSLIQKESPQIVFTTVATPSVDKCETDKNLAQKINVEGTRNIVDGCKKVGAKIIFISTSHLFTGDKEKFTEEDETNTINYYSETKREAEKLVENSGLNYLIIRTDQLYGWTLPGQKGNSVLRVLEKLNNNEVAEDIIDWYNNPTFIDNCIDVIFSLLEKNKTGVYHVVGSSYINRYEWALKVAEIFKKDKGLIRGKYSESLNLPAKRYRCNIDNSKAQKDSGIKLFSIEEGLKKMKSMKQGE